MSSRYIFLSQMYAACEEIKKPAQEFRVFT